MQNKPLALHVGIQYGKGGEGRVIAELCKYLPGAGIDVLGAVAGPDDVSLLTSGQVISLAPEDGPKLARFLKVRSTLVELLRDRHPDIIASHFALYTLPILDKLHTRPMVNHFHGPWGEESAQDGATSLASTARGFVEKTVYGRADRVIVLSKAFSELAATQYGIDQAKIRIVPGSVDIARFSITETKQEARERLGLPLDRPILLSVRRLVRRMGLLELTAAMQEIKSKVPDVLLCIAGTGLLREQLEHSVDHLGLTQHVRFLGFVADRDLPALYRAADVNVVPTTALEGFGLVAAEALAAGTPSMVTPVGGLPDVVSSLSFNLIFRSSQKNDLAEGLIAALLGQTKLPDSAMCANYASVNFSSTLMAARTAQVYGELL